MKNALTRNLRYGLDSMAVSALQIFVGIIGLRIWLALVMPSVGSEFYTSWVIIFMLLSTGLFIEISWFSTFYKNIISSSISRKTFYTFSFIIKVAYSFLAAFALAVYSFFAMTLPLSPLMAFVGFFVIVFALECLGDFYGILLTRFGKVGFIVYMLSFCSMLLGVTFYTTVALLREGGSFPDALWNAVFSLPVLLGLSIISVAFLIMNWFLIKTSEIKS